jgi:hypothetical protein
MRNVVLQYVEFFGSEYEKLMLEKSWKSLGDKQGETWTFACHQSCDLIWIS